MSLQKHCNQVGSLIADKRIGIYMGHLLNNFVFCNSVCSAPKASAAKDKNKDTVGNTDMNKDTVGNTDVNKDTVGNTDVNKDTVGNTDVDTISKRKRKLTRKNISMYILLHVYATTCDLNAYLY